MNNETFLEEKGILERKIAHLCNEFVQGRDIHIENIYVNYGTCNKGHFPNWAINIDINTNSILEVPCGTLCKAECNNFYRNLFSDKVGDE